MQTSPGIADADERFMAMALEEAALAFARNEVPVGAVLTRDGEVIARDHNRTLSRREPTAHAEILVLRAGAEHLGNHRLMGTTLYCTLEPCLMCAGALIQARVARLVYGAPDPKGGAVCSLYRVLDDPRFNHAVAVSGGIRAAAGAEILSRFFLEKRITSRRQTGRA